MEAEELQRVAVWFGEKWKHGACPVCEANAWAPNPRLGQIPNFAPLGNPFGVNVVPVLLVYCTNCGYTIQINALVAGILKPPEIPEPSAFDLAADRVAEPSG